MNRKLFREITVVLAVLIVGQLLNLALQIHSDIYHYSYDEDTFLYTIQDGRYSELPEKKRRNEMEHVKADAQLQWQIIMKRHPCTICTCRMAIRKRARKHRLI